MSVDKRNVHLGMCATVHRHVVSSEKWRIFDYLFRFGPGVSDWRKVYVDESLEVYS